MTRLEVMHAWTRHYATHAKKKANLKSCSLLDIMRKILLSLSRPDIEWPDDFG